MIKETEMSNLQKKELWKMSQSKGQNHDNDVDRGNEIREKKTLNWSQKGAVDGNVNEANIFEKDWRNHSLNGWHRIWSKTEPRIARKSGKISANSRVL